MQQVKIILGVIGADCHAVGNQILEKIFTQNGIEVINLGVMVSQDEFIDAAIETKADAICVSSLYGQGELDCEGLRGRCIERGLEDVILYVGGNLVIGKKAFPETEETFKKMGFDRVFSPDADINQVSKLLIDDVAGKRGN
ncbi:MAG: methylaspartate mutase subunit S [Holophagaceae bacterium]|nr:methylaspartate mutase subunit S [Holophagaceae bacterium]